MAELNVPNRTFYNGDNLDFLRALNSESVNLIATDPPFNKNVDAFVGKRGASFKDRWRWVEDVHEEWVDQIKDNWPAVSHAIDFARATQGDDDMAAFMAWLSIRLIEMHRVLAQNGSIYLHLDHTAHAYVKVLMDAIFGPRNFRNEIVWCYSGGGQPAKDFPRKHDIILRYTKSGDYVFNRDDVRVPYDSDYAATVFAGADTRAPGKTYTPDPRGKVVEDWWRNIPRPYGKEIAGYPTQKPLALYERIIKASSNEDDVVLDPFAGCATTPIAAERLGRHWVGVDISPEALEQVRERMLQTPLGADAPIHAIACTLLHNHESGECNGLPERTDEDDTLPTPTLRLRIQRPREPWEKLTHSQIRGHLTEAQTVTGMVVCAGCGRGLESAFMELDHIQPKSESGVDNITNRIMLCKPCNGYKSDRLTLRGLRERNKKDGWMHDESAARIAQSRAKDKAEAVRQEMTQGG